MWKENKTYKTWTRISLALAVAFSSIFITKYVYSQVVMNEEWSTFAKLTGLLMTASIVLFYYADMILTDQIVKYQSGDPEVEKIIKKLGNKMHIVSAICFDIAFLIWYVFNATYFFDVIPVLFYLFIITIVLYVLITAPLSYKYSKQLREHLQSKWNPNKLS